MKRSKLPFMPMGVMTGRYFMVGNRNINTVTRDLRKRFKNMRFTVAKSSLPGILPDKVLAENKNGKEVTQEQADKIEHFIEKLKEDH